MTDEADDAPAVADAVTYYAANPVIAVTLFGADGRAEMVVFNTEEAVQTALRPTDVGWLRERRLYGPDEQPFELPAGGYAVDTETREITLL